MFVNAYAKALVEIFERRAEERIEDVAEERALIEAVASGADYDGSATVALMYAYAPALRSGARWYFNAANARGENPSHYDHEEIRARAIEGLLKAVRAFNPEKHDRLAAIVREYVLDEVVTYAADSLEFTVSPRTLKRYFAVLRAADQNVYKALALCGKPGPGKDLSKDTFLRILSATRDVESYDAPTGGDEDSWEDRPAAALWTSDAIQDVESRIMVEMVFDDFGDDNDLTHREAEILLFKYGFKPLREDIGDRAISDAMVAREIGSTRPTVAREHGKALDKARARLGA